MNNLYLSRITELIERAGTVNAEALEVVSARFASTLGAGGLVHLFGSGHSVLPCQEAFPRYGSFVGLNPLTDPRLMWHDVLGTGGVRELLWLERTEGYIAKFLDQQPLNDGDCLIVFSHSGANAAGIDAARYARERGLFVVAVSSGAMRGQAAKHSSGQRLPDAADAFIDTCSPVEDSLVSIDGWSRPVSGSSTVMAMILVHELIARTAAALAERGVELPVFASPTIPGVTLGDTDRVYTVYRERMLDAQRRHLDRFRANMGA